MMEQVRILPALCAIHNFIRRYDPQEITDFDGGDEDLAIDAELRDIGELAAGPPTRDARERAGTRRERIADEMWQDYLNWRTSQF